MVKIGELSDIVRQTGIRAELEEEFLKACIRDVFMLELIRDFNNPQTKFLAEVKIVVGDAHINDFIDQYSLSNREEKLKAASKARDCIMDNCTALSLQNSYVAKVRGATRNYAIDGDYHEPDNEGSDITDIIKNCSAVVIASFVGGFLPGYIGVYVPSKNLPQGLVWGIPAAAGGFSVYAFLKFIAPNLPSVTKRKREMLGSETIINSKILFHQLERILGRRIDEYIPSKGRYGGRSLVYHDSGGAFYKIMSRDKSSLRLREWLLTNPDLPLFRSPPLYPYTADVIWSVIFNMKIDGNTHMLYSIKSFKYVQSEKNFIDYNKELNDTVSLKISKS